MPITSTVLANLPPESGVYQFFDSNDVVIYVGKAQNLKNRVKQYFQSRADLDPKTRQLASQVERLEVIITPSPVEALLLENQFIKRFRPKYNILLKDDKSYPYLFLSDANYPRLDYHRGAKRQSGRYFGPYPNGTAVRETLAMLQKIFKVRQCTDHVFKSRSTPCLQYQIKRCSAPCVDYVSQADYQSQVSHVVDFLEGNPRVVDQLQQKMDVASISLNFELAAQFRDQIALIRQVMSEPVLGKLPSYAIDVIAIDARPGLVGVIVLMLRHGQIKGTRVYYPAFSYDENVEQVLGAFLNQYYLNHDVEDQLPKKVYLNHQISDAPWLEAALMQTLEKRVKFVFSLREDAKRWMQMAHKTLQSAMVQRQKDHAQTMQRFNVLKASLKLDALPARIECFDISHHQGEGAIASCVVFDHQGALKSQYRKFNINDVTPGDDYAAIKQAVFRRFKNAKEGLGAVPDVLLIDGGKGQVKMALEALSELELKLLVVGISKGPERRAGDELLFINDSKKPVQWAKDNLGFHLLQQVRDEAHRFAITSQRKKMRAARVKSVVDEIPGIGAKRKKALLQHFGGVKMIKLASVEQIAGVPGISLDLAQKIIDHLK